MTDRPRLTYRDAGVDRAAADRAKQRISELANSTRTEAVVGTFGAFGGCFRLEPGADGAVLVASADGVGTKLKVAVMAGIHDTVGYDLVAHCADDILAQGALPLFFLDYLALGEMEAGVVEQVVEGVARACRDVGCALLGGETAEMPDMYAAGEYDLAGFIVGQAVNAEPLEGVGVRPGDRLLGLASNGLHTNGYSLVRRILFEVAGMDVHTQVPEWGRSVAEELLRPHRSYVAALRPALRRGDVEGLAHVTGGGIPGNLPRVLPVSCGARLDTTAWEVPAVFTTLAHLGGVPDDDMWATFNMGIGMIAVVRAERVASLTAEWEQAGEEVFEIGEVVAGDGVAR
ncbi:MAG TPA: phosphoribosylformylglycinamidine cyclo-ligase [Acidobacteriota bacterium]|nr:phosphoribosylformylglycinamidine cyclo-ligase [Acidobacteriota bacterium]